MHKVRSPILTFAALVAVLAASTSASSHAAPGKKHPPGSATQAFAAAADAFVSAAAPRRNFGTLRVLRVDRSPVKRAYLRFNVERLRGKVVKAHLRVFALTGSQKGYDVLGVRPGRFGERAITYARAPTVARRTGSARSFKARTWTTVDVTRLVSGNDVVDFALATTSTTTLELASRESGTTAPRLLVETTEKKAADTKRPDPPKKLQISESTATTLSVSWSASRGNVDVAGYRVYLNERLVGTTTETRYTFAGLTCSTAYSLGVEAVAPGGMASTRSTVSATTAPCALAPAPAPVVDTTPPTAPTNFRETSDTQTQIATAWDPSSDNVGVTAYRLFKNGVEVATVTGLTYAFSGLACSSSYTLGVAAFDGAGNASARTTMTGTTDGCSVPPPPPPPPPAPPPPPPPLPGPAQCGDGIDNDGDFKIDLLDPGCTDLADNDEADSLPTPFATAVSIQGEKFLLNGAVTYAGTAAEGLLLNSRMVQAAFDDENPSTVGKWSYPDTGKWDPSRNVDEFIAALPSYRAKGLRAVTVSMQGGCPAPCSSHPWIVSAFASDGSLKQPWLSRLDRVIRAADQNGIVIILTYFYFGQDERLANESAVVKAVDNATDWVLAQSYRNVLIEINNESNHGAYHHAIMKPGRVGELVNRVKSRSAGRLKVSTSFTGGYIPPDDVIRDSDYVLLHGNGTSAGGVASMIDTVRAKSVWQASVKPIIINEDSTSVANLDAAVSRRVSWGYYDQGQNDYANGFQSPPVNWTVNTAAKQAFFDRAEELTSVAAGT